LSPRFWRSEAVAREEKVWADEVERRRPYFEAVIRLAPDSVEAAAAGRLLADAKGL
jgi:hypothetical protein